MILTNRLLLRPLEEADVPQVARVWGDPRVMEFCGGATPVERLLTAVRSCQQSQEAHGYSPLAVLTRAEPSLIGLCGLKSLPDPAGAELIYHFLPSAWGHGYATEAVLGVLDWVNRRLRYVEASFDPRNPASRNVLLKAGFTYREDRWFDDVQCQEPVFRIELQARITP